MRRIVVALDYGTSNSGASYLIVHDEDERTYSSDEVEVIKNWRGAGASRDGSEKVPSQIVYNANGEATAFGFEASHHDSPLEWLKLLLEPESLKEPSNKIAQLWASYNALDSYPIRKKPADAVTDYLRWLWATVKAAILKREDEDDTELFDQAHLTVVLTVPASWSSRAKQALVRAAHAAGIPEQCIKTLAEPEAAAIHGLQKKAKSRHIGDGDCVLICDAGGGTVDVVAYRVRTREPLSLEQITESRSDFCGSSFVNQELLSQLRSILGHKYYSLSRRTRDRIQEELESIKRAYNPTGDGDSQTFRVPVDELDDDDALGIRDGSMTLDNATVSMAFESVMTQLLTLTDYQRAMLRGKGLELKGVLLVGGFGRSEFLQCRLRQEFSGRKNPKFWAADDAWTAVARGAVACEASAIGRQAVVHSRLSGYNYGIPLMVNGERKINWLVRKGQSVRSDMPTEPYALRIDDQPWLDEDPTCLVYVPIVTSGEDDASDLYTDSVVSHAEIKCRVATSLRSKGKLIQRLPKKAWHIPANLVLYFDGALITFRCKIEDEEVGVAEVSYFHNTVDCMLMDPVSPAHSRADSKVSFRSDSTSSASVPTAPDSAVEMYTNSSSLSHTSPSKKDKKHHFFLGLRTKRDRAPGHYLTPFLGPSAASDLPEGERLNKVYQKGWEPRRR